MASVDLRFRMFNQTIDYLFQIGACLYLKIKSVLILHSHSIADITDFIESVDRVIFPEICLHSLQFETILMTLLSFYDKIIQVWFFFNMIIAGAFNLSLAFSLLDICYRIRISFELLLCILLVYLILAYSSLVDLKDVISVMYKVSGSS